MAYVLDISDWQEGIDWDEIVNNSVEGVIIKFAEGQSSTDCFANFLASAKEKGLAWGAYVFTLADNPDDSAAEADYVLSLLGGEVPPLGVWYDIERKYNSDQICIYDPFKNGVENTTAMCSAFISKCNAAGLMAGIYSGYYNLRDMINTDVLADYVPYWVADYSASCTYKEEFPNKNVMAWQYSDKGNIAGTEVDENLWYGAL
jgi:GH25 family lysozyme M1 (1,4-beta-N-acetylmuramidase)